MVKNWPTIQKMWVLSLGNEDPLENGMATHSSILAWNEQRWRCGCVSVGVNVDVSLCGCV